MTQVLYFDAINFAEHGAIGIVVAFGDAIGKQRRSDNNQLFIGERRLVEAPRDQRVRRSTEGRAATLIAQAFEIVLRRLRKNKRPENKKSRLRFHQVGNDHFPLGAHRKIEVESVGRRETP